MASLRSFSNRFVSLVLLLFHLGCFIFKTHDRHPSKKRKSSPSSRLKPRKALCCSWAYLKRIFSFKNPVKADHEAHPTTLTLSSQQSILSVVTPVTIISASPCKRLTAESPPDYPSFPLRNDIFPCPTCGEIFHKTQLLEQHQSIKHAVSELFDGDSGKNIVQIIFRASWNEKVKKNPAIQRILKIHNSPKILSRFEEYRESVKSKAARNGVRRGDERCIADGNEHLRFHCTTFACDLGQNGNSNICNQQFCSVCGIIKSGFSSKMDGISTLSNSWRAHVALPDEIEEEFAFMNVKRAMLLCRVVAGRIGCDQEVIDKDETGFDSVIGRRGGGVYTRLDEGELLVFNPRAVLPCFVIIYCV
ncbi:hypothetical protein HHK36_016236 [Tetracentron sinense]|uniref:C2H2-type domain-containing protein n=1 Tax=Tetracentron sinense TaxID=13715 RepID=A0A835DAT9_TETSI|nr:hypothetical protein HHK36_016236 [Tetracentron sinense]